MDPDFDAARREALARIDALERELRALVDTVRGGASRLESELARVRAGVEKLRMPQAVEPEPPAPAHTAGADVEGARLVALDLVLRGTPRAQAERELADGFPGVDAAALIDEATATSAA